MPDFSILGDDGRNQPWLLKNGCSEGEGFCERMTNSLLLGRANQFMGGSASAEVQPFTADYYNSNRPSAFRLSVLDT